MLRYAHPKKAVVLHSGGMDSSICLALALREFGPDAVLSLGCSYGQRHHTELAAAERICKAWNVDRAVLDLTLLQQVTDNALVNRSIPLNTGSTLVMGRNGLMTFLAAVHAQALGVHCLYLGVIEADAHQTGYRDCSRDYFDLQERFLRLDLGDPSFVIRTPLVKMTKKQTIEVAQELSVLPFLLKETISCYEGLPGVGCEVCFPCRLRSEGLRQFLQAQQPAIR